MPRRLLVPERGLHDTVRNRRWLAIIQLLGREIGGDQGDNERLAWKILAELEKVSSRNRYPQ